MEQARLIHLSMEIWGIIFAMLAYLCEWLGRETDKSRGKKIRMMLLLVALLQLCDACAWGFRGNTTSLGMVMTRVSNISVFFIQPGIFCIFIDLLCMQIPDAVWKKKAAMASYSMLLLTGLVLVSNMFVPFMYAFDETNHYYRQGGYILYYLPVFGIWLVCAYVVAKGNQEWDLIVRTEVIVVVVSTLGCMILQILVYGISYTVLGCAIFCLMIAFMHLAEKINMLLVQENELKEMKLMQLRAQMQPHFMFNSLTTIRSLIRRDPNEAYMALTDFSRYLRGSLTSLSDERNWSVSQEMQMVEGYLSLEKRRFGDNLQIAIEIEDTDFFVPILSIQTLVENAVRHGICAMTGGSGCILVRTRKEGNQHVVTIWDSGVGFDPKAPVADDGRVHFGLANTRKRVEENGEMIIESAPGEGTTIYLKFFEE